MSSDPGAYPRCAGSRSRRAAGRGCRSAWERVLQLLGLLLLLPEPAPRACDGAPPATDAAAGCARPAARRPAGARHPSCGPARGRCPDRAHRDPGHGPVPGRSDPAGGRRSTLPQELPSRPPSSPGRPSGAPRRRHPTPRPRSAARRPPPRPSPRRRCRRRCWPRPIERLVLEGSSSSVSVPALGHDGIDQAGFAESLRTLDAHLLGDALQLGDELLLERATVGRCVHEAMPSPFRSFWSVLPVGLELPGRYR